MSPDTYQFTARFMSLSLFEPLAVDLGWTNLVAGKPPAVDLIINHELSHLRLE